MSSTAIFINVIAILCLVFSLIMDRQKTRQAVKIAMSAFLRILPQALLIIVLIGLLMGFISPAIISRLLGQQSGMGGIFIAAVFGAVLHIPSIISFPLAASLLQKGAAATVIATFITTLTMIGMVTLPLEMKELGKKFALWRNGISFIVALLIGLLMGWIL